MYIHPISKEGISRKQKDREKYGTSSITSSVWTKSWVPWRIYSEQESQRMVIGSMKGKFSSTGLTSLVGLRNGFWYLWDTSGGLHLRIILVLEEKANWNRRRNIYIYIYTFFRMKKLTRVRLMVLFGNTSSHLYTLPLVFLVDTVPPLDLIRRF